MEDLKKNKTIQKLYNFKKIFSKEWWKQIFIKLIWKTLPRHRHVDYLANHLNPLPKETPDAIKYIRDMVFRKIALDLKDQEERETLSALLNECSNPYGVEQIFFTAIYPFIRKRGLIIIHHPNEHPNRMDIELGYEGHFNKYVFWMLEIDGASNERAGKIPRMRWELIDNERCPIYHIGAAAIFDRKNITINQLIINAQNIFVAVHEDLKNYGFRIRQPKEIKSIAATANLSLIQKWELVKRAAEKKSQMRR